MTEPVTIGNATLYCAPSEDVLLTLPDNSVDSIVTDPPYGLTANKRGGSGVASVNLESPYGRARIGTGNGPGGFMGQKWDAGVPPVELWAECLRVLKPGGHLLAFGGARTYHRLAVAVEDAGFEIRDQIMWIYGSGFPKSRNVGREVEEYDGWGTALKPAHEPIVVARKPLDGTVAANVLRHGTGAINVDGCRVEGGSRPLREVAAQRDDYEYQGNALEGRVDGSLQSSKAVGETEQGRWPANVIHDGSEEVVSLFPAQAGAAAPVHKRGSNKFHNSYGKFEGNVDEGGSTFQGDRGSAARFFYCAKASRKDRNEGCEALDERPLLWSSGTQSPGTFQAEGTKRAANNNHPTVKPTDLMRYLCRLVTPPGGTVLDPFMGSGSTGKAALQEGFAFIGIDKDADYFPIAEARITHCQDNAQRQGRLAI